MNKGCAWSKPDCFVFFTPRGPLRHGRAKKTNREPKKMKNKMCQINVTDRRTDGRTDGRTDRRHYNTCLDSTDCNFML
jgi:hypothetical protein